jgi:hypothetical protein
MKEQPMTDQEQALIDALEACVYMLGVFHSSLVRQGGTLTLREREAYQSALLKVGFAAGNDILDKLEEGRHHDDQS